jgi:pimeloyl-ACP methyl ester carboxylesterase
MTDPTVVLVHGAWHGGWCWSDVVPLLDKAGLAAVSVDLPSSGGTGGLTEDAALVRATVESQDGPTVVVGHSYGGIVITEATAGLTSVQHLVYVCAFMIDAGASLVSTLAGDLPPWITVDEAAGVSRVNDPVRAFYADVAPDVAAACSARLTSQTLSSFATPVGAVGWREHPSSYLACTEDNAIPYAAQRAMSANAGTVETIPSSHSPFLSQPDAVADLVVAATRG